MQDRISTLKCENVRNVWNLFSPLHADAVVRRVARSTRNSRPQAVHEAIVRPATKGPSLRQTLEPGSRCG